MIFLCWSYQLVKVPLGLIFPMRVRSPLVRLALGWIELWLVPTSISKSLLRLSEYFREAPIGQPHEILFKIVLFRAYHKCKSSLLNQETANLHLPFKIGKHLITQGKM